RDMGCLFINLKHYRHLSTLLGIIVLVDTDGIDPNMDLSMVQLDLPQSVIRIVSDLYWFSINDGRSCVVVAPCVRDRNIWRCIVQAA
ncbi:UNVERIFIED_CONTAM: hypothetical protein NY603_30470, partial [Bacteroidetes bacterium 56_B9]